MYNNNVDNVIYLYELYLRLLEINWCLKFFCLKRVFNLVHTVETTYKEPVYKTVLLYNSLLILQYFIVFGKVKILSTVFIEIIIYIYHFLIVYFKNL